MKEKNMNINFLDRNHFSQKKSKYCSEIKDDTHSISKKKDRNHSAVLNSISQNGSFSFIPNVLNNKKSNCFFWRQKNISQKFNNLQKERKKYIDQLEKERKLSIKQSSFIEKSKKKSITSDITNFYKLSPKIDQEIYEESKIFSQAIFENLVFLEEQGQGTFAKVIKCHNKIDWKSYALKLICIENDKGEYLASKALKEYQILQILKEAKCTNIIKCFGLKDFIYEKKRHLLLLLEYGNCTLEEILNLRTKNNILYEEDEVREIFYQLLNGFHAARKLNIFHGDIKPANIVYCASNNKYKFIDWGEAKLIQVGKEGTRIEQEGAGTPYFMAPELRSMLNSTETGFRSHNIKYNGFETDIFSLGKAFQKIQLVIRKGSRDNPDLKRLVDSMTKTDPTERNPINERDISFWLARLSKRLNLQNEREICENIERNDLTENFEKIKEMAKVYESLFL